MKRFCALTIVILILCSNLIMLTGCSSGKDTILKEFIIPESYNVGNSGIVAKNENYSLFWDSDMGTIKLTDLKTGTNYSTIPEGANDNGVDDFGFPILASPMVNSPITITYVNPDAQVMESVVAYVGCISRKSMCIENIDNGICVTYFFEDEQIAIPVKYVLREDGIKISIDPKSIMQGTNRVVKINIAPYLCATKNTEKDSYLFTPSGSGSLIYPKVASRAGIVYSEPFYGEDVTMQTYDLISNTENLLLPVFGVKNEDSGMAVIVEQGAELASLKGIIGAKDVGYSNLSTEFTLLGYDRRVAVGQKKQSLSYLYAPDVVDEEISIGVYPLSANDANYFGIAQKYKSYLEKKGKLGKSKLESTLHLKFLGGAMIQKSLLGVPYKTLYSLTTIDEVKNILEDISKYNSLKMTVELDGYGETGLTINKLAGDYSVASKLGSISDLKQLQEYCVVNNDDFYFDFNLLSVGKSANGWSYFNDIAVGPTGMESYQYGYSLSIKSRDTKLGKHGLLSRNLIDDSAKKLIKKINKWELDGVGVGSLASVCYSDYANKNSYARLNMSTDVEKAIVIIKDSNKKVLVNSANSYAACKADEITDIPLQSSQHDAFDVEIPFYQIVFSGIKNMTSSSINLSKNQKHAVLSALESGCGLSYSIINNYDSELINLDFEALHCSLYTDIKQNLIDTLNRTKDFYNKISGASIQNHVLINDEVRKTVFDNGIVLYVNYGDTTFLTENGELKPNDFLILEGM